MASDCTIVQFCAILTPEETPNTFIVCPSKRQFLNAPKYRSAMLRCVREPASLVRKIQEFDGNL